MNRHDGALSPVPPLPPDDAELLERIRRFTHARGSYGYHRVTALVNRELITEGKSTINHKRMYRVCAIISFCCIGTRASGRGARITAR